MSEARIDQHPWLDLIWPRGAASPSAWAVFDCARDPAIYRMLLGSRLEYRCLYSGAVPRELEVVAPHLVELPPGHRLAQPLGIALTGGGCVGDREHTLRPGLQPAHQVQRLAEAGPLVDAVEVDALRDARSVEVVGAGEDDRRCAEGLVALLQQQVDGVVVGRHQQDFAVLQLAHAFEQATQFGKTRPAVAT